MLHCVLRVRWKVASDLRFRAAISEPKTPFFLRDFWRFGSSARKSLAIAIVRFWCAKCQTVSTQASGCLHGSLEQELMSSNSAIILNFGEVLAACRFLGSQVKILREVCL